MLPSHAYSDTARTTLPGRVSPQSRIDVRPGLVIVAQRSEADSFPASPFTRLTAQSTEDAIRLMEESRPRLVAIDWDLPAVDGVSVCTAARRYVNTSVLVLTAKPERAPAALKAGCHGILLKPFAPNLIAARLGRIYREAGLSTGPRAAVVSQQGTNRVWVHTLCPQCGAGSATSFEFHSHRRMWYACLPCSHVWLGPRQE